MLERLHLLDALGQARADQEAAQRIARLAAIDLRDAALRLHGQAGSWRVASNPVQGAKLAALAERCRMLADDLSAAGLASTAPTLCDESVDLLECAREAAEAVAATIAPGRRQFRLPPRAATAIVWADRRAIRQVLGRVLAEAALNTGDDDWICVSCDDELGQLRLTVADEGLGLAGSGASADAAPVGRDSRGIGAPLALARALMQAHGGRLEVLAAPGAGTRAALLFPPSRRRGSAAASATPAIRATLPS